MLNRKTWGVLVLISTAPLMACGSSPGPLSVYTVGGTVTGLISGGLVLQNNGADDVTMNADGAFTFPSPVSSSVVFRVTVKTHAPGHQCTVQNGTGTVWSAKIVDIGVTCTVSSYSVGGTVQGLSGSKPLVLRVNDGGEEVTVSSNGTFSFKTSLAHLSSYAVTPRTMPEDRICTVEQGTGTVSGADVTTVAVTCIPGWDAVGQFKDNTNPNGTWSYGFMIDSTSFTPFSRWTENAGGVTGLSSWQPPAGQDYPMLSYNETAHALAWWGVRMPPDLLNLHPDNFTPPIRSVLRWTSPTSGTVVVTGRVLALDATTSDFALNVKQSSTPQVTGQITTANGMTLGPFELVVAKDDTLDFSVGRGTNDYGCDSTGVSVTIVPKS